MVVVACNTATAAAIRELREKYPRLIVVGIEPALKLAADRFPKGRLGVMATPMTLPAVNPAAINTKSGAIGVLATKGTFKGELYLRTLHKFASNAKVIEQVGEGLVELVESGDTKSEKARELVGRYIIPMIEQGADHIVLGCTHYPFLADTISKVAGVPVTLIDPAPAVAKHLMEVMQENSLIRKDGFSMSLHSSGEPETLKNTYNNLI